MEGQIITVGNMGAINWTNFLLLPNWIDALQYALQCCGYHIATPQVIFPINPRILKKEGDKIRQQNIGKKALWGNYRDLLYSTNKAQVHTVHTQSQRSSACMARDQSNVKKYIDTTVCYGCDKWMWPSVKNTSHWNFISPAVMQMYCIVTGIMYSIRNMVIISTFGCHF